MSNNELIKQYWTIVTNSLKNTCQYMIQYFHKLLLTHMTDNTNEYCASKQTLSQNLFLHSFWVLHLSLPPSLSPPPILEFGNGAGHWSKSHRVWLGDCQQRAVAPASKKKLNSEHANVVRPKACRHGPCCQRQPAQTSDSVCDSEGESLGRDTWTTLLLRSWIEEVLDWNLKIPQHWVHSCCSLSQILATDSVMWKARLHYDEVNLNLALLVVTDSLHLQTKTMF
jgi:hypothetical protein